MRCVKSAVGVVAAVTLLGTPRAALAADLAAGVPVAVTCALTTASVAFGTQLGVAPAETSLTVKASGTCVGSGLVNTITVSLSGPGVYSCGGGEGTVFGFATWNNNVPNAETALGGSVVVAGPALTGVVTEGTNLGTFQVVITDLLQWALCATQGVSSLSAAGIATFVAPVG